MTVFSIYALAYVGPGAGLGALGALVAVLLALILGVLGALLYPIQLLRRHFLAKRAKADGDL